MLRELCVERRGWLEPVDFEHALAAVNILPGPASTQLSIYCAWRLRGYRGAILGGLAFILPGLVLILALSALFLAGSPPRLGARRRDGRRRGGRRGRGAGRRSTSALPLWAPHAARAARPRSPPTRSPAASSPR